MQPHQLRRRSNASQGSPVTFSDGRANQLSDRTAVGAPPERHQSRNWLIDGSTSSSGGGRYHVAIRRSQELGAIPRFRSLGPLWQFSKNGGATPTGDAQRNTFVDVSKASAVDSEPAHFPRAAGLKESGRNRGPQPAGDGSRHGPTHRSLRPEARPECPIVSRRPPSAAGSGPVLTVTLPDRPAETRKALQTGEFTKRLPPSAFPALAFPCPARSFARGAVSDPGVRWWRLLRWPRTCPAMPIIAQSLARQAVWPRNLLRGCGVRTHTHTHLLQLGWIRLQRPQAAAESRGATSPCEWPAPVGATPRRDEPGCRRRTTEPHART